MKPEEFINLIEHYEYLADNQVAALRRQLVQEGRNLTPEEIAGLLLAKQHLTKYQAKRLIAEARGGGLAAATGLSEGRRRAQEKWLQSNPMAEEVVEVGDDDLVALDDIPGSEEEDDPFGAVDLGGGDELEEPEEEAAPGKKKKYQKASKYQKKEKRANPWDSPLLLLGGGGLVLMFMVGGLLYFWLTWDTGDELFQQAEADYRAGSYVQAGAKYEKFLGTFSSHPQAPMAELRLGMSNLRRAVDGTSDFEKALQAAQEILPTIEQLEMFADARPELATLLPDISAGLATSAQKANSIDEKQRKVDLAEESFKLINNPTYMPTSQREVQQARIDRITADLQRVRRGIERDQQLAATLAAIEVSSREGNFQEIYAHRRELLELYPTLRDNEQLLGAIAEAAQQLLTQIKTVDQSGPPQTQEFAALSTVPKIMMADIQGTAVAALERQIGLFRVEGVVYAIELSSGKLLWRRYVGVAPLNDPLKVDTDDGRQLAVMVDSVRDFLVAVDATSGKLVWRVEIGAYPHTPVEHDGHLLIVSADGVVRKVNITTGEVARGIQLPQPTASPLGVLPDGGIAYAVAEHSNLFLVSLDDLSTREIIPLGHESGTITCPPVGALRHLFIFENVGIDHSLLHVFKTNAAGGEAQLAQAPIRVPGRVLLKPIVADSRVIATNDQGSIFVFEVNPGDAANPVRLAAATKTEREDSQISYAALDRGALWVADRRLTRYDMQLSRGAIVRKLVDYDADQFLGRPHVFGNYLVHVRRQPTMDGLLVVADQIEPTGLKRVWETIFAVPNAGEAFEITGLSNLGMVTSRGTLYGMSGDGIDASQVIDTTGFRFNYTTQRFDFRRGANLDDATRIFYPRYDDARALVIRAQGGKAAARVVTWEATLSDADMVPDLLGKRVIMPTKAGQVFALDPLTGASGVHPFQPELSFGSEVNWGSPVVLPGINPSVMISDGDRTIYRLAVESDPEPNLGLANSVELEVPIKGGLGITGLVLAAITSGEEGEQLVLFQLPELAQQESLSLNGHVYLYPTGVGDRIYLATEDEGLMSVGEDFSIAWSLPLEGNRVVGLPVETPRGLAVAMASGAIWLIDQESGERLQETSIEEPGISGMSVVGDKLWVYGFDGTIHQVSLQPGEAS